MCVNVIVFGQLTDITRTDSFQVENVGTIDSLVSELNSRYPAIAKSKYIIAVDKVLVTGNADLPHNCTVALLPPFSGG